MWLRLFFREVMHAGKISEKADLSRTLPLQSFGVTTTLPNTVFPYILPFVEDVYVRDDKEIPWLGPYTACASASRTWWKRNTYPSPAFK
jgi:hypothetical protein